MLLSSRSVHILHTEYHTRRLRWPILFSVFSTPQAIIFAAIAVAIANAAAVVQPPNVDLLAPLGTKSTSSSPAASPSAPSSSSSSSSFTSDSILRFEQSSNVDGSYQYAYETDAGSKVEEQGVQKTNSEEKPTMSVAGSFEYPSPDGTIIRLTYVADENGFQPTGDHLPVAPPVPEAIQRALRYIQEHSAKH